MRKGFTAIECLIVVLIIASTAIAGIAYLSTLSSNAKVNQQGR